MIFTFQNGELLYVFAFFIILQTTSGLTRAKFSIDKTLL